MTPLDQPASREEYFKLMELHNTNRIDYNNRKWETIKYAQTLGTALFAAGLLLLANRSALDLSEGKIPWVTAFPFAMAAAVFLVSSQNLRRESRLLFLEEGMVFRLAHLLKLDRKLQPSEQLLANDNDLLMHKWRKPEQQGKSDALREWVDNRMKDHAFSSMYAGLFAFFVVLCIAMIVFIFS